MKLHTQRIVVCVAGLAVAWVFMAAAFLNALHYFAQQKDGLSMIGTTVAFLFVWWKLVGAWCAWCFKDEKGKET